MQESVFLVIGADGTASEVAKDILLTGCSVDVLDDKPVSHFDLAANAFLRVDDIGKPRADVLVGRLAELNPQKSVKSGRLTSLDQVSQYSTVVYCCSDQHGPVDVCNACRSKNVPFVLAESHGLCGRLFCDFGNDFTVVDADGEKVDDLTVSELMIDFDAQSGQWALYASTKKTTPFVDGSLVLVRDVQFRVLDQSGADNAELAGTIGKLFNDQQYRVQVNGPRSTRIILGENSQALIGQLNQIKSAGLSVAHLRGGYMNIIKEPVRMHFKSLQQLHSEGAAPVPDTMMDFTKFESQNVFQCVYRFIDG